MRQFRHLNVPEHWEHYWSKYPQGYTVMEALISWVSQVNQMVDDYTQLQKHVDNFKESVNSKTDGFRDELDDFMSQFDTELRETVELVLSDWQESGFLDIIINTSLQTQIDTIEDGLIGTKKQFTTPNFTTAPRAAIVDDDGYSRFLTEFKPVLDAHNVKATLAVITDRVDDRENVLTTNELHQLQSEGHEIVSHTDSHLPAVFDDENATDAAIEEGFKKSFEWLKERGFSGYNTLVYPWGARATPLRQKRLARKYYTHALTSSGGYNVSPMDNMYVYRVNLSKTNDFETYYKPIIDEAFANNGTLIWLTHSGDEEQIDGAFLNTVISYMKSIGFPLMTFGELIKLKGNALAAGEYTQKNSVYVGLDGSVKADELKNNVIYLQGISPEQHGKYLTAPITSYKEETVTIFRLSNTYDGVANEGGVVIVNRTNTGGNYGNAIFITGLNRKMYVNSVDADNNWRGWKLVNNLVYLQGNTPTAHGKTMNSPITEFDIEATTIFRLSNAHDPLANEGGTITVNRPNNTGNYSNATFISGLSQRMFINTVDADNQWRGWKEVAFK